MSPNLLSSYPLLHETVSFSPIWKWKWRWIYPQFSSDECSCVRWVPCLRYDWCGSFNWRIFGFIHWLFFQRFDSICHRQNVQTLMILHSNLNEYSWNICTKWYISLKILHSTHVPLGSSKEDSSLPKSFTNGRTIAATKLSYTAFCEKPYFTQQRNAPPTQHHLLLLHMLR